jgi:hypothetical protein
LTGDELRKIFLRFPGVEEAPSYGAPGFRVRKKLLARIHPDEPCVVLRVRDIGQQEALIAMDPETFYLTDHYRGYAYVLARRSKRSKARSLRSCVARRGAKEDRRRIRRELIG